MLKKILLPISAVAMMAFVACGDDSSLSSDIEDVSSSSTETPSEDVSSSSAGTPSEDVSSSSTETPSEDVSSSSAGTPSDEAKSSSSATEASSSSLAVESAATCKVVVNDSSKMELNVVKAEFIDMTVKLEVADKDLQISMKTDFGKALSAEQVASICDTIKAPNVECNAKGVSYAQSLDNMGAMYASMIAPMAEEFCKEIDSTGTVPEELLELLTGIGSTGTSSSSEQTSSSSEESSSSVESGNNTESCTIQTTSLVLCFENESAPLKEFIESECRGKGISLGTGCDKAILKKQTCTVGSSEVNIYVNQANPRLCDFLNTK